MTGTQRPVAVVTGGSRGIGKAIVEALARAGAEVWLTYVSNEQAASALVEQLEVEGASVQAERVDSRDGRAVSAFVERVIAKAGKLDVLVHNAGITRDRLLGLMSESDWNDVLATTLNGLYGACRPAARQMMRQRSGRILNISSVSGLMGFAGQTNYSAAKAAVIGFTRSLSRELAPVGACANVVAPGYVDTDMLGALSGAQRETALSRVPMKRFGTADEVAHLVRYLALEAPSFLTGQTLVIDGGMTG